MSEGVQETVRLGLKLLARKVEEGVYGEGDDAFDENEDDGGSAQVFLNDLHDEVLDKIG